ncbi:MAG: DUF4926 domain-containing protein [Bacillota bacterium]
MFEPFINRPVQLKEDVPALELHRGQWGVVCSRWSAPEAYEVEFAAEGQGYKIHALLAESQIDVEAGQAIPGS